MDAALRSAYYLVTGKIPTRTPLPPCAACRLEGSFVRDSRRGQVRTAVVSGLGNTRKLLEAIASGLAQYDFVEVMACPGGCAAAAASPSTTVPSLPRIAATCSGGSIR